MEKVINATEELSITSLSDLETYKQGTVVRLPDFAEGQPFIARVRRPSMLVLAKSGKIPNSLLKTASELFSGGTRNKQTDENTLKEIYEVCHIVCESTLIEPSLKDIEDIGVELSDDQLMAIFNYSQIGVRALNSFR